MNEFVLSIANRLAEIFDPATLGAGAAELLAKVLIGSMTFAVYYLAWRGLARIVEAVAKRAGMDATGRGFTRTLLQFAVLSVGLVAALGAIGINTASLLASLGIAGLTLGFAARDALSNVISGVLIFWDRPFVIGDLVEVGPSYGRVDRITLRSTRIVTPDGRMLAVPNTEIINTTVASYTNFPHLRVSVELSIGVGESFERVRTILLGLVQGDARYMDRPAPDVTVTRLGDFNNTVVLSVWIYEERRHVAVTAELREQAFDALTAAGVDMPYETFNVQPITVRREDAA
ncbi:MAG: mechanosensitive ion channel family protein [Longimicrobiales bacterium]